MKGIRNRANDKAQSKLEETKDYVEDEDDGVWSEEEDNEKYIMKPPQRPVPEAFDIAHTAEQPKIVHIETHSHDYIRSKYVKGDARVHKPKVLLPHEMRVTKYPQGFRLPLPYIPAHVRDSLGEDIIEHLWTEFLLHDADESELVQIKKLKSIAKAMERHLGYYIPLAEIRFPGLESDDYIDFQSVTLQLVLNGDKNQRRVQQVVVPEPNYVLGRCCAIDACEVINDAIRPNFQFKRDMTEPSWTSSGLDADSSILKSGDSLGEEGKDWKDDDDDGDGEDGSDDEDEPEGPKPSHALHLAYLRFRLDTGGRVKVKHICDLMDQVRIPYDKSRIPSSEWTLRGELLLQTNDLAQELCERIRTDRDYERNKAADDIYSLPRWMEQEFKPSEIMLFKHQFGSIDTDGGGTLNPDELIALTVSMGNPITEEQAKDIIALVDTSGKGSVSFSEFMMLLYKIQNGVIDLSGNYLAQAMLEAKSQIPIFDEIEAMHSDPPPFGHIIIYGGSPVECDIAITGPPGTLYEGGTFRLRVVLHNGYPFRTPTVTFLTRVYHINVLTELDGMGYLPHLKYMWDSSWSLRSLVGHIVDIFRSPRLDLIPVEYMTIIKVFLWEEEEKRRIAEEARLAELARLAEIARLEEEAKLAAEAAAAELIAFELAVSKREIRDMSCEDKCNEFEIVCMEAEDADCPEEEEKSVGTFTSDLGFDDFGLDDDDDAKAPDSKADAKLKKESKSAGSSSKASTTGSELNLSVAEAKGGSGLSDADPKSARSVHSVHSAAGNKTNNLGMFAADDKLQPSGGSRRGSKASVGSHHSQASHKSWSDGKAARGEDEYEYDNLDQQPNPGKPKEEETKKVRETFIGFDSQEMLKTLARCEQMHLVVVQMFTDSPHLYEKNTKSMVQQFALTTHHDEDDNESAGGGDDQSRQMSVRSAKSHQSHHSQQSQHSQHSHHSHNSRHSHKED